MARSHGSGEACYIERLKPVCEACRTDHAARARRARARNPEPYRAAERRYNDSFKGWERMRRWQLAQSRLRAVAELDRLRQEEERCLTSLARAMQTR